MGHGLGSGVSSLAVLPDGRLVSAGFDGEIKLWLVDEQKLIATLCQRAGRNLTKKEWTRYIGRDEQWQPSCSAFGVPSNWRTVDDKKSGALAPNNTPAETPPASSGPALESPASAPLRAVATPIAPENPWPPPAQHSQHVTRMAPHGDMTTQTGNTTDQLNQQELARQKSVASTPDNIISGFFRSLFR
jgi:WD40 repeat protein